MLYNAFRKIDNKYNRKSIKQLTNLLKRSCDKSISYFNSSNWHKYCKPIPWFPTIPYFSSLNFYLLFLKEINCGFPDVHQKTFYQSPFLDKYKKYECLILWEEKYCFFILDRSVMTFVLKLVFTTTIAFFLNKKIACSCTCKNFAVKIFATF